MIQFPHNHTAHPSCDTCGNGLMSHFQTSGVGVTTGFRWSAARA